MTDTLKPCPNPWCEAGDRTELFPGEYAPRVTYSNFGLCFIACTSCRMEGPSRDHEAEAIAAWNTRPTDPQVTALVEALEALIAAVEFEAPPIIDGIQVVTRGRILLDCAKEARVALAAFGSKTND